MSKKAMRLSVTRETASNRVKFEAINNATGQVVRTEFFTMEAIHPSLRAEVALYGLSKLYMDRTSEVKENPIAKLAMMREQYEPMFAAGEWEKERAANSLQVVSAKVEAVSRLKGFTIAKTQALLASYKPEQKAKIFGNPKVVALIAEIEKERLEQAAQESNELEDLLAE